MENTRIWQAVYALVTAEGDLRTRVCIACREINVLGENELNLLPNDLGKRIKKLLKELSRESEIYLINGNLYKDKFSATADKHRNKYYQKYAAEIFRIYEEIKQH
jgi:hypothetical protein